MKEFIFEVQPLGGEMRERVSVDVAIRHDDDSVSECGALTMDRSHWSMFNLMLRAGKAMLLDIPKVVIKEK